jgi:hypothetical protein
VTAFEQFLQGGVECFGFGQVQAYVYLGQFFRGGQRRFSRYIRSWVMMSWRSSGEPLR